MLPVAEDVLSFSSGVWSNQSISQLTPITQIKDRLDTLESHQSLWNLQDTNFPTPTIADDQKVVAYDSAQDKFILKVDAGGIPDAPSDSFGYVWKDGSWELLANAEPLPTYGTIINQHTTSINTLNGQQVMQDNRLNAVEGDIINLDGEVLNL